MRSMIAYENGISHKGWRAAMTTEDAGTGPIERALSLGTDLPADRHPVAVYLAALAPGKHSVKCVAGKGPR